jgi:hypothetical protein
MTEVKAESSIPFSEIRSNECMREIRCQPAEVRRIRTTSFGVIGGPGVEGTDAP